MTGDVASGSELLSGDCFILGQNVLYIQALDEQITDDQLSVILKSQRERSKPA